MYYSPESRNILRVVAPCLEDKQSQSKRRNGDGRESEQQLEARDDDAAQASKRQSTSEQVLQAQLEDVRYRFREACEERDAAYSKARQAHLTADSAQAERNQAAMLAKAAHDEKLEEALPDESLKM